MMASMPQIKGIWAILVGTLEVQALHPHAYSPDPAHKHLAGAEVVRLPLWLTSTESATDQLASMLPQRIPSHNCSIPRPTELTISPRPAELSNVLGLVGCFGFGYPELDWNVEAAMAMANNSHGLAVPNGAASDSTVDVRPPSWPNYTTLP